MLSASPVVAEIVSEEPSVNELTPVAETPVPEVPLTVMPFTVAPSPRVMPVPPVLVIVGLAPDAATTV